MKSKNFLFYVLIFVTTSLIAENEEPSYILRLGAGLMGGTGNMSSRLIRDASINENLLGNQGEYSYGHIDSTIEGGKTSRYAIWPSKQTHAERWYLWIPYNYSLEIKFAKDSVYQPSLIVGSSTWGSEGYNHANGAVISSGTGIPQIGGTGVNFTDRTSNRERYAGIKLNLIRDFLWMTPKIIHGYQYHHTWTESGSFFLLTSGKMNGYTADSGFMPGQHDRDIRARGRGLYPGLDILLKLSNKVKFFAAYHAVNLTGTSKFYSSDISVTSEGSPSFFGIITSTVIGISRGASNYTVRGGRGNAGFEFDINKHFKIQVGHFHEIVRESYPNYHSLYGCAIGFQPSSGTQGGLYPNGSVALFPTVDLLSNYIIMSKSETIERSLHYINFIYEHGF